MDALTRLELEILHSVARNCDAVIAAQIPFYRVSSRKHTGVGRFTDLLASPGMALSGLKDGWWTGSAHDHLDCDVPYGMGYMVHVRSGVADQIEIYTNGNGPWDGEEERCRIRHERSG